MVGGGGVFIYTVFMDFIKTKSFQLAVITRGDEKAEELAVCLPGRLDTKDYANFISHMEYLGGHGFFALSFDPPGTWESPGGLEIYSTTNYIKAVNEVIEYYGNKPTLLLGHSRGGTVSILVGAKNPSVIGIVVVNANFGAPTGPKPDSLEKGYELSLQDLPPATTRTKEKKEFKLPIAYFKDGEQYRPVESLKQATKPKLVFYSTNDEFVTPTEAQKVLEQIPEPKMAVELSCTHDYRLFPEAVEQVNKALGQFLDAYLKSH